MLVAYIPLFACLSLLSRGARTAEKLERIKEVIALGMDITALLNTQSFIDHP